MIEKLIHIQKEIKVPKSQRNTEWYENYIQKSFQYYDGVLIRSDRKNSNGSLDKDGYLIIKVKGRQFKAHRIVWLLYYGSFPNKEIDHINHNRLDNRIENLREATRTENNNNHIPKINKDTNVVGIHLDKCTKGLIAKFCFKYKKRSYRFRTLEEAISKKEEIGGLMI